MPALLFPLAVVTVIYASSHWLACQAVRVTATTGNLVF